MSQNPIGQSVQVAGTSEVPASRAFRRSSAAVGLEGVGRQYLGILPAAPAAAAEQSVAATAAVVAVGGGAGGLRDGEWRDRPEEWRPLQ